MAGALLAATANSGGLNASVTVGSSAVDLGKGGTITVYGYASSDVSFGAYGSMSPATWNGFPIRALYWSDSDNNTYLILTGDASTKGPVLTAAGAAQSLGAGSFASGETTFVSATTKANPFPTPAADVAVSIT